MTKILFADLQGVQQLVEVGEGGGVCPDFVVLWDERTDGPVPEITINGMERVGDELIFSQALLDAYTPPVTVPASVTMAQARKSIILAGISIAAVDAALQAIPDETERALAIADWEYSADVIRANALVATMAPILGLSDEQLDQLFIAAAAL